MTDSSDAAGRNIRERHSCRAFTAFEVPEDEIRSVLRLAQTAPSSKNTQPWKVVVVRGTALRALSARLLEAAARETPVSADYVYSQAELPPLQQARARQCGYGLYALKGIARGDHAKRREHWLENYKFFGASQAFIVCLERHGGEENPPGNFLDAGLFIENLWLALRSQGYEACAQYSVAAYAAIIREALQLPESLLVLCAMPFGRADPAAPVNRYRTERAPLEEWVIFRA